MNKSSYHLIFQAEGEGKLYLGNWASTMDTELTNNISAIVNCTKANHPKFKKDGEIPFLRINMQNAGSEKYEQSYKFIDENLKNGKNVLVHCAAGACRSVGVCIFFLMKKNGWTLEQTHAKLKKIRSEVADLNEDSLSKYISEIVEHLS